VNRVDAAWAAGRVWIGIPVRIFAPLRVYGRARVPRHTGVVLALNHFSWLDPPTFGVACPRTIYYMAKIEAHRVPGLGELIRSYGTFSVRRGESDREAVRRMREVVRERKALGVFVEGTRQRSGVPGAVQPGAAMVAIQEGVPVVCAAIHGSQAWKFGNFAPVSVAWGEPISFDGVPRGAKGYREASAEIEREIHRLWSWLRDLHDVGGPRPLHAVPPRPPAERRAPVTLP
jgi:1-acyl-sn-glycerol-3-phosphate acyltransferase